MAGANSGRGEDLAHFLSHNVREHVEVVLELLSGDSGVTEAAQARLLAHIAEEERSNSERLNTLLEEADGAPPRELRLIRDHSDMLLDILEGAIPQPLGLRLLHHMLDEHRELLALGREEQHTSVPTQATPRRASPRLTVGSLRR